MTIWFLFNQYASLKKMLLLTKRFLKVIDKIFFFIELFPISEKIKKKKLIIECYDMSNLTFGQ